MTNDEYRQYLAMMNQWLILKQEGKGLEDYLKRMGYQSIAVYGMGIYGRHVIRELKNSDIRVRYGIDRNKLESYQNIEIIQPTNKLPEVDIIINTVVRENTEIRNRLKELVDYPVVSLEEIIFESY